MPAAATLLTGTPAPEARLVDALVERAREGDTRAFEGLMASVERQVVSVAYRMLGSKDQARDAAQDVFLRMYRHLGSFRRGEDFPAWVYRITVNVCYDALKKRRPTASFDEERETGRLAEPASTQSLEEDLLARERDRAVRKALETLPPKERAAIVLRDLEGLPTEEVARALGSRPATVRSQIASGRLKVRLFCDRLFGTGDGGIR